MSKRVSSKIIQQLSNKAPRPDADPYALFDRIDGRHSWQDAVPEGSVLYAVRPLKQARVAYFNFALAREMGLIPDEHPGRLTPHLERKIIDTFALQIINEYDLENRRHLLRQNTKPNKYMATRYLQLQHADKSGRTSGDGRGIWNGEITHKGKTWDISSRGTGVTCLAPGAVEAKRHLKTGDYEFGYGCGLADIDELWGSSLMSEIFHLQGVQTERVLTILDLGKGVGIGVRAGQNLFRPAHLFLYLKQEKYDTLKRATDYFIQRQTANRAGGAWKFSPKSPTRYRSMLQAIAHDFGKFAANLERNYIFAWMDWDGDNVLASAGIIDYGSIRQFGLRHDQYRYDDVQRFSTNLNEQKNKARMMVQVFAQLTDYLKTGVRKPIQSYSSDPALKIFDKTFERELRSVFLEQVGFDQTQRAWLLEKSAGAVERLYQSFSVLERTKTKDKIKRVPDGINRPAIFKMRAVLRELPAALKAAGFPAPGKVLLSCDELMTLMTSNFARRRDTRLSNELKKQLVQFQDDYVNVVRLAKASHSEAGFLRNLAERAQTINQAGRITGNSAEFVIDALLTARKEGLSLRELQMAMEMFVLHQTPARRTHRRFVPLDLASAAGRLYQELLQIALEYEDEI